jgi:hypothetical protein
VTKLYKSLSHKDYCPQSWSSLHCLVMSYSSGLSSAPGLMSWRLAPISHQSTLVIPLDSVVIAAIPCYRALAWTAQKTPSTAALLSLCDIIVVTERCLLCHHIAMAVSTGFPILGFQQNMPQYCIMTVLLICILVNYLLSTRGVQVLRSGSK